MMARIAVTLLIVWRRLLSWRPGRKLPKIDHEQARRIAAMRAAKFR
jgi:hypothetical protein